MTTSALFTEVVEVFLSYMVKSTIAGPSWVYDGGHITLYDEDYEYDYDRGKPYYVRTSTILVDFDLSEMELKERVMLEALFDSFYIEGNFKRLRDARKRS